MACECVLVMQGVQFHPESIITNNGKIIIQNFVEMLASTSSLPAVAQSATPALAKA